MGEGRKGLGGANRLSDDVDGKIAMKVSRRFNSTTPAHELADFQTPNEKVFVVYHMGVPERLDPWPLEIAGLVEKPLRLSLAELDALPKVELCAFHECAGSPLRPTVPVRRVGNVVWRGVPLRTILGMAGIRREATHVWARGADSGLYPPTGACNDAYVKDLPLEKALTDQVLLASEMNGAPLSDEHGAPLRLVVPGYYGTNAVKWLTGIRLERARADSYFTTTLYNDRHASPDGKTPVPVWAVAPNSLIVAPSGTEPLPPAPTEVWGWAWGAEEIARVEVSVDGGETWRDARLQGRRGPSWQRFSLAWNGAAPGEHRVLSRATDAKGACQPPEGARNEVFSVTVRVNLATH